MQRKQVSREVREKNRRAWIYESQDCYKEEWSALLSVVELSTKMQHEESPLF